MIHGGISYQQTLAFHCSNLSRISKKWQINWTKARDVLWSRRETHHTDRRHRLSQLCFCACRQQLFWESRHRTQNIIGKKFKLQERSQESFHVLKSYSLCSPWQSPPCILLYLSWHFFFYIIKLFPEMLNLLTFTFFCYFSSTLHT